MLHFRIHTIDWLTPIFLSLILLSCAPEKKLLKEADILNQGGLSREAYAKYESIYKTYLAPEALISMKKIAQQELNTKLNNAAQQCVRKDYDNALLGYENAFAYLTEKEFLEIQLPIQANENYINCKNSYLEEMRISAELLIFDGNFLKAEQLIRKIYTVDRNYPHVGYLEMICDIMPHYNAGKKSLELGLYRNAWVSFNEVCKIDINFRNSKSLRDECLQKGSYTLVYKIKPNFSTPTGLDQALATTIKGELLNSNNPFLEILERDNLGVVLQEQQESLNPHFASEGGAEPGKLKRAQFVLSGELIQYKLTTSIEQTKKCDCATNLKLYSEKVECFETTRRRNLNGSYKFQLIDAETGKLYLSDVIAFDRSDDSKKYNYEIKKKISFVSPGMMRDHDVDFSQMKIPAENFLESEQDMNLLMNNFIAESIAKLMVTFQPH